jgi:hypothetical protein
MEEPSSPIELIKRSVDIFSKKDNFWFFIKIYSFMLPFSLFFVLQGFIPGLTGSQVNYTLQLGVNVLVNLLYLLISTWVSVSAISSFERILTGEKLSAVEVLKKGCKKYWWSYFLLTIVLALISGIGFILLIVPGILFITWFAFARFILVEKGLKIKECLIKSREMVRGRFWKIFGRLLIFGIFELVVEIIFSAIPYGIGSIFTGFLGALFILPSYLLYKELE